VGLPAGIRQGNCSGGVWWWESHTICWCFQKVGRWFTSLSVTFLQTTAGVDPTPCLPPFGRSPVLSVLADVIILLFEIGLESNGTSGDWSPGNACGVLGVVGALCTLALWG